MQKLSQETLNYLRGSEENVKARLEEVAMLSKEKAGFFIMKKNTNEKEFIHNIVDVMIGGFLVKNSGLGMKDFVDRKVEKFISTVSDEANNDFLIDTYDNITENYSKNGKITSVIKFIEEVYNY